MTTEANVLIEAYLEDWRRQERELKHHPIGRMQEKVDAEAWNEGKR